jgi:hypothetical protein
MNWREVRVSAAHSGPLVPTRPTTKLKGYPGLVGDMVSIQRLSIAQDDRHSVKSAHILAFTEGRRRSIYSILLEIHQHSLDEWVGALP